MTFRELAHHTPNIQLVPGSISTIAINLKINKQQIYQYENQSFVEKEQSQLPKRRVYSTSDSGEWTT
jgi:hypothetical protein